MPMNFVQIRSSVVATKVLQVFSPLTGSTVVQVVGLTRIATGQMSGTANSNVVGLNQVEADILTGSYSRNDVHGTDDG